MLWVGTVCGCIKYVGVKWVGKVCGWSVGGGSVRVNYVGAVNEVCG